MRNSYEISLDTDKNLDSEQFGRPFLEAWLKGNPKLRPERFGHGEPVRHSIEEAGLEGVIAEWRRPPALMFKRISNPKFVANLTWREVKGKDPRPYPWGIRIWLDRKAGDGLAVEFFEFLLMCFDPAFAWITSNEEGLRKHLARYPYYKNSKLIGTAEQYVGSHVLDTLPGIYWLTYLTPKVIDERLLASLGDKVLRRDERGGFLIRAHEKFSDIGSELARKAEDEIIDALGRERFFDLKTWKPPEPAMSEPSSTKH